MRHTVSDDRLTQIYEQHSDMVYRIAFTRMANEEDAGDVFQEVFMKLVENINGLDTDEHIRNWLIRVTINCRNSAHRRHRDTVDYDDELAKEDSDDYPAGMIGETGEDALLRTETRRTVREILQKLKPPEYRTILYLAYFEELRIEEIARALGITQGNAKTKLSRARAATRKAMTAWEEG